MMQLADTGCAALVNECEAQPDSLVSKRVYRNSYFDGLNRFYVSRHHFGLTKAFASPPNVFDGFTRRVTSPQAQTVST